MMEYYKDQDDFIYIISDGEIVDDDGFCLISREMTAFIISGRAVGWSMTKLTESEVALHLLTK